MTNINLNIKKDDVYNEVAKTTSYTGAKMLGANKDDEIYDRIFTTDADREMLDRFWAEACNAATEVFKPFLMSIDVKDGYSATLEMSSAFDTNLVNGIQSSVLCFLATSIVGKWYQFTNKEESGIYAKEAANILEDVKRKIYFRKRPRRKTPSIPQ